MMADPSFQAQAKAAAEQMKNSGAMPDAEQMKKMMNDPAVMEKARAMAQAMGMAGGAGMGPASDMAEMARLQAENARLRSEL